LLVFALANAEITNPGLGSIFMSQSTPNTLNIVSTGGIHTMLIGSHAESDVGPSFAPDYSIQGPDGTLYGGNLSSGTLVKYDITGHTTVLHTFSSASDAGTIPTGLIYRNGYIYGEVSDINSKYIGSLWKVAVDGSNYTILHQFTNNGDGFMPTGLMIMDDQGNIYGSTYSSLYRIDNNDNITFLTTQFPTFDLVYRGGYLYGSAMDSSGYGFLYKLQSTADDVLDPNTTVDIHDFSSADVMSVPQMLVLGANGKIYGTADDGYSVGRGGFGHIFSIDESDNVNPEYGFHGYSDGADPIAIVFESNGTTLHGVTRVGGPDGLGAVFTLETAIANKPESYINFVTEYLPRNEYQFGPSIISDSTVEIKCMPSGTFYHLQESQAITCPSPNDNQLYFGRDVSNIPTQADYIAGTALVQQTPIDNNNVAPTISTPLFDQQSMLVTNVDKYDVLSYVNFSRWQTIGPIIQGEFKKAFGGTTTNALQAFKLKSPQQQRDVLKQIITRTKQMLANVPDDRDGDTYGVTRYLNNNLGTGGAGIQNNTNVSLYVMCVPENKLFIVPASQTMYCQHGNLNNDLNTTGMYIGYNLSLDPNTGSVDITSPSITSNTINYTRGVDFGTTGSQDAWSTLNSGHAVYLSNVSNFENIVVSGTPDGAVTGNHCPDNTQVDQTGQCYLTSYSTTSEAGPEVESGRLFIDAGGVSGNTIPNFTQVTVSNFWMGNKYGYYSNFGIINYPQIVVDFEPDPYVKSGLEDVTVHVPSVSGNIEITKTPSLYLTDNTNNESGVTTLCEPSNVPIHNMPNTQTKPKYSSATVWALSLITAFAVGVLGTILIYSLVVLMMALGVVTGGLATLAIAALFVIVVAGLSISSAYTFLGISGNIETPVTLPATGSVCYASDQRLYEGTFDPASAAAMGESGLVKYATQSLGHFGMVDMGGATTFDGSGEVTANNNSYVEKIINFENLTTHSIDKDASGNGIYYKGY